MSTKSPLDVLLDLPIRSVLLDPSDNVIDLNAALKTSRAVKAVVSAVAQQDAGIDPADIDGIGEAPEWQYRETRSLEFRRILKQTDRAILLERNDASELWVPKSVIADISGDAAEVSEWWCSREGVD